MALFASSDWSTRKCQRFNARRKGSARMFIDHHTTLPVFAAALLYRNFQLVTKTLWMNEKRHWDIFQRFSSNYLQYPASLIQQT